MAMDLGIDGLTDVTEIGSGGSAVVYSAVQQALGRHVAVKILNVRFGAGNETERRRFEREQIALGRVSDLSGIVPLYESGFTDTDRPYLIMPLYEAGSLQGRLDVEGALPWGEAAELMITVARAVQRAHTDSVLHRDLKPANIMIGRDGSPTIGDFGVARLLGSTTLFQSRALATTPAYAPPEVFSGEESTAAVDVYGLGATLFALVNGSPAFVSVTGDMNVLALMRRVDLDPVPDLRKRGVPDSIAAVIERSMAKAPSDRHAGAAEWADELERALTAALTRAEPDVVMPVAPAPEPIEPEQKKPEQATPGLIEPESAMPEPMAPPWVEPEPTHPDPAQTSPGALGETGRDSVDALDAQVLAKGGRDGTEGRRTWVWVLGATLVLVVGLVILNTIAGPSDDDDPGIETADDESAVEEPAAADVSATDSLDEVVDDGTDGVLRLGGILPQTGVLAWLGPPEFAAVQLAVNEINEAGGVLGAPVEWLPGDSGTDGEVVNATVDRLLAEDVDVFIGAASSATSLAVIDKITEHGKVQFSPANTSPTFTTYDDNGLYFRTAPSDEVQGAALADVMLADGAETAAFLVLDEAYGSELQRFTVERFTAGGGTVVYGETETYDPQAADFDAEIAAVVAADPDAIVIIGFDETSEILGGLIEVGFGPADRHVYGTDGNMGNALAAAFPDPSVLAGMKGTLPGVDVAGMMGGFRDALLGVDPHLIDFSYSAESYDIVVITALAASIVSSDDGVAIGAHINGVTREGEKCTSFADCLALVEAGIDIDYDGVSGPLEFSDVGEPSQASILVLEFDTEGVLYVDDSVLAAI